MGIFKKEGQRQQHSIKRELIFANIAVIVLGILIVIFPESSTLIICRAVGVVLTIWGFFRIGFYFIHRIETAFGSFGLVQGVAILGFGIYFLISPESLASFLTVILSIVLIVGGAMKLQYGIDLARVRVKYWWIPLAVAGVMLTLGIIAIIDPFGVAKNLMLFIGISLIVNGITDLLAIVFVSIMINKLSKAEVEINEDTLVQPTINAEATDVPNTEGQNKQLPV